MGRCFGALYVEPLRIIPVSWNRRVEVKPCSNQQYPTCLRVIAGHQRLLGTCGVIHTPSHLTGDAIHCVRWKGSLAFTCWRPSSVRFSAGSSPRQQLPPRRPAFRRALAPSRSTSVRSANVPGWEHWKTLARSRRHDGWASSQPLESIVYWTRPSPVFRLAISSSIRRTRVMKVKGPQGGIAP